MTSLKFITFDFLNQGIFQYNFKKGGILRNTLFFWRHFLKLDFVPEVTYMYSGSFLTDIVSDFPFDKLS